MIATQTQGKLKWTSFLILCFLLALTTRLLSLFLDPILQRDSALYIELAEKWQMTGNYTETLMKGTIVPPLHPFLIKTMIDFGFESEIAGRSLSLFFGSIIPVLGYSISYAVFKNVFISGISALILIFHPQLISFSLQPLRESIYLFFIGLSLLELIKGLRYKELKSWGLCGFFLAFAIYSRYESIEILILCPLILFFLTIKKKITLRRTIENLGVFYISNITTVILLLSITHFDISFLTKVSKYSDSIFLWHA